ncbi:Beta-galactosidase 8 [Dendrobium catenatum]|uniref:Beta-galactosidase n=1 Tax=Dendrobium catenatum TaxID=906689 RepID=A0A2I0WXY4_9ASPA|nr:Beta-galactosidase 8 [Dendrobium catenatum]
MNQDNIRGFKIAGDMFWKDGQPFRIIGGDLHYFRVLPEYWEDRLLRAKALGLNAIQTYVAWNLHEPSPQKWVFEGIANIESFLNLTQELGFLVMLPAGWHSLSEWDLGGFPAWLLSIKPSLKLRSSDPRYINLVERWWGILLPKIAPFLYENGGPIVMVQVENEFGSFGYDKTYLRYLATLARRHLGNDIILYTTDGGTKDTLERGTIPEEGVYAAVDFSTGENPWPIFELQKRYNAPGKSPPLSAEFYTGWLTHWGEPNAKTSASYTAAYLEKILSCNGSVVLYMAYGGTNFGFFNGANTGQNDSDYKADLTSYDYDAPIKESGDIREAAFNLEVRTCNLAVRPRSLRNVIEKYSPMSLPPVPSSNERAKYRILNVNKVASLFNVLDILCYPTEVVETDQPIPMELVGQMFGFMLYVSQYSGKGSNSTLSIPKVHDRAQVFISCTADGKGENPTYVGTIERWSNKELELPNFKCSSNISLFILLENMGRINYGPYIYDRKGILSSVALDGYILHGWKLYPISLDKLSLSNETLVRKLAESQTAKISIQTSIKFHSGFLYAQALITRSKSHDSIISDNRYLYAVVFEQDFNGGRYKVFCIMARNLDVPFQRLKKMKDYLVCYEMDSSVYDDVLRESEGESMATFGNRVTPEGYSITRPPLFDNVPFDF